MTGIEDTRKAQARTERKTKAAAVASGAAALVGLTLLSSVDTDMVKALPDWLETPAYALLVSAAAWAAGYLRKHAPTALSQSAIQALRERAGLSRSDR